MRHSVLALAVGIIVAIFMVGCSGGPDMDGADVQAINDGLVDTAFQPHPPDPDIDIKPGSNPNPINVKKEGVLPVAILTSATFDATQVDPTTVRLLGVAPIRWVLEDVLVSPEYEDGPPGPPDGDIDLLLFFDTQELVATGLLSADTVTLTLTATTFGGLTFTCTDTTKVLGLKKTK